MYYYFSDTLQNPSDAVNSLDSDRLSDRNDRSDFRKKSLFMIAYVYNNNLHMYTDAHEIYNKFMDIYPNDELIPSVKYELDQIDQLLNQINNN